MIKEKKIDLLDFFDYRILTFIPEALEIIRGKMPIPRMVIFHPTYICNHRCVGCDFKRENVKYKRILSKEESNHIIDELINIGIKSVEFSGGGEPLMDKNTAYHIRRLGEEGIQTGILTNGSFLLGDMQKVIIENCSYVRISLESGSNEEFKKAKGITDDKEFPKVIKNIEDSIKLREKIGSPIDISLKFTVGAHNYRDMRSAVALAMDLRVDSIQFKQYQNVDSVKLEVDPKKNLEGKVGTLIQAKKELQKIKEDYGGQGLVMRGDLEETKLDKQCWLSPLITVIDALGDIYLCSYYRHRQDTHKIGNLLPDKSFKDIWGSKKHRETIANTKIEECNKYDCRFHRYNKILKEILLNKANRAFTSFI